MYLIVTVIKRQQVRTITHRMFCIGLSLSIVMLLARNAWGTHQGPYYLWEPHIHFANQGQCPGWTGPCGSYYDCKTHLSNSHKGNLKKTKLIYSQVLESTQHAWATQ